MFKKLFGNFKNIGSKIKTGWNIGRKIFKDILPYAFGQIGETISTYKSIEDPLEKQAFKEQIGDIIGNIPSQIILNPVTEFFVKKKDDNFDDWEN
jgi:hypothetical protein